MSLKEEIVRINKNAKIEKLFEFYNLKSKDSFLGFYNCPICNYPELILNEDFNTAECLGCGKRFLSVSFVESVDKLSTEDAINKIKLILNLSNKPNDTILFLLWNMCDDGQCGDTKFMRIDNLEQITSFLLSIKISRDKIAKLHLERLIGRKFKAIKDRGGENKISDLLIYDDKKCRVFSLMRKEYNVCFLIRERKKFNEKK